MAAPIRIANGSGFFGDRHDAMLEMVESGPIDVLTGDYLAELTMLILARSRMKRPEGGYARTFLSQLEQVMGRCLDRGIKVVVNAGGLDPAGCAAAVRELADRLGLTPSVAHVDGDDLMPRMGELTTAGALQPMPGSAGLGDPAAYLTANAYLGCWGIVTALDAGADIVVTGRVTDAALTCGPAAWHHGWRRDDWDALAGGVVAGHVLECGAHATGGNYSFFAEIDGYADRHGGARFGFPWAEVAADGSSVIGKHDGTGGEVSIGTVTSQLLYEIGAPAYLGPDVTARFDTIGLEQSGPNRVRIGPVAGEPPPPTLKVGISELGGYRNRFEVALTGLDIEAKAAFAEAAFWNACPHDPDDFAAVVSEVVRTDRPDPPSNEEATAVWRLTVKDPDEQKVGRAFSNAMVETALSSIPGLYARTGGPTGASPYGVFRPAVVAASSVTQTVHLPGGDELIVPSDPPVAAEGTTPPEQSTSASTPAVAGRMRRVPLGRVVGTRSGDKGGDANLGVFVRHPAAWPWLDGFLTTEALRRLLPEAASRDIDRYRLPNLLAVNFVIHGLLDEGVAAATRPDAQAKSLGEWLRARLVDVPEGLLSGAPQGGSSSLEPAPSVTSPPLPEGN